ncbi:hypothetical protein [Jannaschia sp. LMIT008]|uniref:hypothetical protein n=1 Tax=Jannaschia maritima TaxID=3032585 RepID=UPI00281169E1|nr:hypothetical protein [Jannaschia sp. LMIT008]
MRSDDLDDALLELEDALGGSGAVATRFAAELASLEAGMTRAGRQSERLGRSVQSSLRRAFDVVLFDGAAVGDAARGAARSVSQRSHHAAISPIGDALAAASPFGGGVNVTMNVATPDVAGFQRTRTQIAGALGRAIARGQRNQ